jgi:transcriptional regulator GlxA family with amidase domain
MVASVERVLRGDARLARVPDFVAFHLHRPLPRAEIAALVGLAENAFSRRFRQRTGVSFHTWLQHLRLTRALTLMRDPRLPLRVIAAQTGFGTLRALQRACRAAIGHCPRLARRAQANALVTPPPANDTVTK